MRRLEESPGLRPPTVEVLKCLDTSNPLGIDETRDGISLTAESSIYNVTRKFKQQQ